MLQLQLLGMGSFDIYLPRPLNRGVKSQNCTMGSQYFPPFMSHQDYIENFALVCIGFRFLFGDLANLPLLTLLAQLLIRCCAMALKYYSATNCALGGIHAKT